MKLRLSKGPCRFDAIFFSTTEAECGVAAGARVDAAFYLQANTFRGATTLQLQLIDLRPSLTPSRHEGEALDLLHRLLEGEPLTAQEAGRLNASRDQFGACWLALGRRLRSGKAAEPLLPFIRQLAAEAGGSGGFRALVSLSLREDILTASLNPTQGKVDLFACPYLARLREGPMESR